MKLLGLIHTAKFSFSATDSLMMLHFASARSKMEYASVAWKSVTLTDDSSKISARKEICSPLP